MGNSSFTTTNLGGRQAFALFLEVGRGCPGFGPAKVIRDGTLQLLAVLRSPAAINAGWPQSAVRKL